MFIDLDNSGVRKVIILVATFLDYVSLIQQVVLPSALLKNEELPGSNFSFSVLR